MREIFHFVGGKHYAGTGTRRGPVMNPTTGEQQAEVLFASPHDLDDICTHAARAAEDWGNTSVITRSRVMARYQQLLWEHKSELATMIAQEHGKVLADAEGDVVRGIEAVEFAVGVPHLLKGEYSDGVSTNVDMYSLRRPLGVVAGITPFNFPAMIPLWMMGVAVACGNAIIIKPSEKDPSCPVRLAELFMEAGGPEHIFNVVHGDKELVDALLAHPTIQAISFVGSTPVAKAVYAGATAHGKRAQCMGGAKNHLLVMPDADMDAATNALMGAAFGSAGERCMATPVAVAVGRGTAEALMERLQPRIESLKIGPSLDPDSDMGPLVTKEHRDKVRQYFDLAIEEGSKPIVDGRDFSLQGYEGGYFMGACLFDQVTANMTTYKEEIFGPSLQIVRADDFEQAARLPSDHQYGNGTAIFTKDGRFARQFAQHVQVGMVGINVPIPVPLSFHTFGGWKASAFGGHNQHGMEGVRFYTKIKTITARWDDNFGDAQFVMPTHG
ncbi:MAG: CoA-acylating methylmalonate-semialdehyde dehydrogenase [Alphaproteobacteria bacterium]